MHEDAKTAEAEYFLERLAAAANDPQATRYEASAFLSAARSVLQYAREEAQTRPGGQSWYNTAVGRDPLVKFLRDHRDINVHHRPLPMRTNTNIEVGAAVLTMTSTLAMVVTRASGEQEIIAPDAAPVTEPVLADEPTPGRVTYNYFFKGWLDTEEVVPLCERYLAEVKRIVADGRSLGILTL